MSRWWIGVPAVVLGAVMVPAGLGALIGRLDLVCPVDGHRFKGVGVRMDSTVAGVDRDLFGRSGALEGVFCLINTCPKCLYSGYVPDFNPSVKISPQVKRKILKGDRLKQIARGSRIDPEPDQLEIPARLRYELAAQVYQWRGRSEEALAWLYLRKAWVCREEGSILPKRGRIERLMSRFSTMLPSERIRPDQADRELELATRIGDLLAWSRLAPQDRPAARFIRAFLLRRHGEVLAARDLFRRLQADAAVDKPIKKPIAVILESIEAELASLSKAREHLRRAVERSQIGAANVPVALYLVGELSRRLGDYEEAVKWYDRALQAKGLPEDLRNWAREQRTLAQEAARRKKPDRTK